jgi:hypothetical protein
MVWLVDPDSIGSLDSYLDPGGRKWPTEMEKVHKFFFWSDRCSLLRAEGFSCSLDIREFKFFDHKTILKNFSALFFFFSFWSSKPWIRIDLKWWIRIQWIRIHSSDLGFTNCTYGTSSVFHCTGRSSGRLYPDSRKNRCRSIPSERWEKITKP